ncbi:MAG: Eco57I restriction-modification methylase domain-containing protein, partial [Enterococcus sp.]|nr:Eco57I restriction-modification methylase domain-containing protein [Enterococcus sp.]
IPEMILNNNLFGFEIDKRAAEIAMFALEMKAREKDSKFFEKDVDANIFVLDSIKFEEEEAEHLEFLNMRNDILDVFEHFDEIGSLYVPKSSDEIMIKTAIDKIKNEREDLPDMLVENTLTKLNKMRETVKRLSETFSCVVANPPYLSAGKMDKWPGKWLKDNYKNTKADLFAAFIERGFSLASKEGYNAMVTMQSWMFLGSFENMRADILDNKSITCMAHLGARTFAAIGGEVVQTVATVIQNSKSDTQGSYIRLVDYGDEKSKSSHLIEAIQNPDFGWFYRANSQDFKIIPGSPIAYWACEAVLDAFKNGEQLSDISKPKQGLITGMNDKFVRMWWEVNSNNTSFDSESNEEAVKSKCKWFPNNKGGEFRKWYGNN